MMTPAAALAELQALSDPARAAEMAAYHKAARLYLGIAVPVIDDLARRWRDGITVEQRVDLARGLWATNVHEARIAAAKLLTQARLRPDQPAWEAILSWVPDFDGWAVADHVAIAGQKRLVADPTRIDTVADWTQSDHMWTRRAALVFTLPWTKQNFPKPADLAIRDRVLGWCAGYVADNDWFIQKAVAWWLRDLSRHDPDRVRDFLSRHGAALKPFARKEAGRHLNGAVPVGTEPDATGN